ncbi:Aldo-keto reductase family 1 member A1 [Anthophora retusa]
MENKTILLPNGQLMPIVGFGTWQMNSTVSMILLFEASEEELQSALDIALETGYRHIDTAPVYENEEIIGKVLKKWFDSGKLKRSEVFVVTKVILINIHFVLLYFFARKIAKAEFPGAFRKVKLERALRLRQNNIERNANGRKKELPPIGNRPEDVEYWIKKSLQNLQLTYVDLYLIHTPFTFEKSGNDLHPVDENGQIKLDQSTNHVQVWKEMEKQVECGRAKAIGLSNYNISQIERILKNSKVKISMLQIELHVYFQQKKLVKYCKEKNIPVTAYSPLGSRGLVKLINKTEEIPDMMQNDVVRTIAKKYEKSPAQILLRYIVQNGFVVIPKSTNSQRMKENIQIFNWELKPEDMEKLRNLDLDEAGRICDFTFFKGIEKHVEYPF